MASGTISLGTNGYLEGQIVWSSSSNGSSTNSSNIYAEIQARRTNSYTTTGTWSGNLNIDGDNRTFSVHTVVTNSWVTFLSFTITKSHNDDGSGTCYIQGNVDAPSGTSMAGKSVSGEQTVTLDKIARYLSITAFNVTQTTLNIAKIHWEVSNARDNTYYSINNGDWVGSATYGETIAGDNKSGDFYIKNLSPNTQYNLKIKCKRTDSGLWTESSQITVTTKAIATITEANNFNIGSNSTIKFTNSSGNPIQVYMEIGTANTVISEIKDVTGLNTYTFTEIKTSTIYSAIPNANTLAVRYVIKTTEESNTYYSTITKIAYVVNSNPSVGTFTYKDNNTTISAITEDNQKIVRNQSSLLFTIGTATAKNSSTISKYSVNFNGITKEATSNGTIEFGTINLSSNEKATLTVTDSRGNQSSSDITISIIDWVAPIGSISLHRKNNYENESYLLVDGTYSSVNSKNSMTITYQKKETTAIDYETAVTLTDNKQITLDLDNTKAWNFKILIKDKFAETIYYVILAIGKPIMFIDVVSQKVGINRFPKQDGATFQIEGSISVNDKLLIDLVYPVGSIYISINSTNPATLFGGIWERFGNGKTLIGVDESNSSFNTVQKTGGSWSHSHTNSKTGATSGISESWGGTTGSHTLTIAEMPSHKHDFANSGRPLYWDSQLEPMGGLTNGDTVQFTWSARTNNEGGSQGHTHSIPSHTHSIPSHTHTMSSTGTTTIIPTYITCYMWKRTA